MSSSHLSAMPMDPYQWRESVLSTRSLSYLSTADLTTRSRSGSLMQNQYRPRRRDTEYSDSEYDLEMGGTGPQEEPERKLNDIPELPDSVANSLLFILPREIRDRIYSFCMTSQSGWPIEWPPLPQGAFPHSLQPQLLRTCRIIHSEAAPLLYSSNTLCFHHPSDANMFVRAFASTSLSRRYITNLQLHVKAADTRLWMPYLTSTDAVRSLKADFPAVKEVGVRYRSNKWNHTVPPEQNMKTWSEDGKLDEVIDGLRHVFYPPQQPPVSRDERSDGVKPLNEMSSEELMRFVDAKKPGEDMAFKRQSLELHRAHAPAARQPDPPVVKVTCACRVHSTHFNIITAAAATDGGVSSAASPTSTSTGSVMHNGSLSAALPQNDITNDRVPQAEGEPFKGFTLSDFRTSRMRSIHDPDLGSARVASTPFADKDKILLALEVHTLSPNKDVQAEQRMMGVGAGVPPNGQWEVR